MITTFSSRIREKNSGLNVPEPEWIQYLKDHRRYLIEKSVNWYINPDQMGKYRYRLEEYLQSINCSIPAWLVFYLNQIDSNIEFNNLEYILIPNEKYLDELRKSYNTYIANFKK